MDPGLAFKQEEMPTSVALQRDPYAAGNQRRFCMETACGKSYSLRAGLSPTTSRKGFAYDTSNRARPRF